MCGWFPTSNCLFPWGQIDGSKMPPFSISSIYLFLFSTSESHKTTSTPLENHQNNQRNHHYNHHHQNMNMEDLKRLLGHAFTKKMKIKTWLYFTLCNASIVVVLFIAFFSQQSFFFSLVLKRRKDVCSLTK